MLSNFVYVTNDATTTTKPPTLERWSEVSADCMDGGLCESVRVSGLIRQDRQTNGQIPDWCLLVQMRPALTEEQVAASHE